MVLQGTEAMDMLGSCERWSCQWQKLSEAQMTCVFLKANDSTLRKPAKQHQKSPVSKFNPERRVLFVAII